LPFSGGILQKTQYPWRSRAEKGEGLWEIPRVVKKNFRWYLQRSSGYPLYTWNTKQTIAMVHLAFAGNCRICSFSFLFSPFIITTYIFAFSVHIIQLGKGNIMDNMPNKQIFFYDDSDIKTLLRLGNGQ